MSGILDDFRRVSARSRCPVCDRPDWCLVSREGGDEPVSAVCARTESAISFGSAGWLHRLREGGARSRTFRTETLSPVVDHRRTADRFAVNAPLDPIAAELGLPVEALRRLRVGWDPSERCSTWPLTDASGRCVGIVRRFPQGRKKLRQGDRAGLYLPADLPDDLSRERLLVVEGGSDTAAGLAIGRIAVGRYSSLTSTKDLQRLAAKRHALAVSIVADNDSPGIEGAERLGRALAGLVREVRIIRPPDGIKDLRDWLRAGASAEDIERAEREAR